MRCEWRELLVNRGVYIDSERSSPMAEAIIDVLYRSTNVDNSDRTEGCKDQHHEEVQHTEGAESGYEKPTSVDSIADQGERILNTHESEENTTEESHRKKAREGRDDPHSSRDSD